VDALFVEGLENGVLTLSLARLEPQSKATTLSIQ
jgi:HSP20 family molecular chaperone IbpA